MKTYKLNTFHDAGNLVQIISWIYLIFAIMDMVVTEIAMMIEPNFMILEASPVVKYFAIRHLPLLYFVLFPYLAMIYGKYLRTGKDTFEKMPKWCKTCILFEIILIMSFAIIHFYGAMTWIKYWLSFSLAGIL